jgi:hypothetical protein
MISGVLGLANQCIWKSWLTVKVYTLKTDILAVPTDTSGLRDSYRIKVHHYYIMLIMVDIIMFMLIAISLFLLQLIIGL